MTFRKFSPFVIAMKKTLRRFRRERFGVGAVEFAILLPFLMLLLFAIIEFGFIMYTRQNMLYAAREAARSYAVGLSDVAQTQSLALRLLQVTDEQLASYQVTVVEPTGGTNNDLGSPGDVTVQITIPMALAALVNPLGDIIQGDLTVDVIMLVEPSPTGSTN